MNFILGMIVGILGYMLITDPAILSDLLHSWGNWIAQADIKGIEGTK